MAAIHAPMATGIPAGVTAADISPPVPKGTLCTCGCGNRVRRDYEHYTDEDGNLFAGSECVEKFYGIRYVSGY